MSLFSSTPSNKSGCGCSTFFFGCFFGLILTAVLPFVGGYYAYQNRNKVVDAFVEHAYHPLVRPQLLIIFNDLSEDERKLLLDRIDADVAAYLKLPEPARGKVMKKFRQFAQGLLKPQNNNAQSARELEALLRDMSEPSPASTNQIQESDLQL